MEPKSFVLAHDLTELVGDQKIVSASIGPHSEACLLLVSPEDEPLAFGREEQKGFAIFPFSKAKSSYPATFIRFRENVLQQTRISSLEQAFPSVQPLPNNEILVVGARCHFRDGNPEKNAAVLDRDGNLVRQFVLGDGIEDVQTTKDGMIWVSYFDEGVFGNFGWTSRWARPGSFVSAMWDKSFGILELRRVWTLWLIVML